MTARASAHEVNFDCLVGPTHHFGGLSFGNIASQKNKAKLSNPKRAALQGLAKMRKLRDLGFVQAVLPPHERPHMKSFRNLGFVGSDRDILEMAHKRMPEIFSSLCSSSAMWAANAATVSPSFDSLDDKVHISPANLVTMLHRSIEADFAHLVFSRIFADPNYFFVHPPLLAQDLFSDEGAANHNRLCPRYAMRGLQIFVYGKETTLLEQASKIFPARQSKLANESLAIRHRLPSDNYLNIQQDPIAIDHGAFHNDVVAVANENVFLCHELSYFDQAKTIKEISATYERLFNEPLILIEINNQEFPIDDAVSSYLFNSQILSKKDGFMLMFAPTEVEDNYKARAVIEKILATNSPINEVTYFDVSDSMANGGGPACLRLRVLLTKDELAHVKGNVIITDTIIDALARIINKYYVEDLLIEHFFDASFLLNCREALDEISQVLGLQSIYDFQRYSVT